MGFPIKVDEDLPRSVTAYLRARGYDAMSVYEEGRSGCKDAELLRIVQAENRFLVTGDKGFADLRLFPRDTHPGVLLLRPAEDGIRPLLELLQRVLELYRLEDLKGLIAVATPRGVRIRRL